MGASRPSVVVFILELIDHLLGTFHIVECVSAISRKIAQESLAILLFLLFVLAEFLQYLVYISKLLSRFPQVFKILIALSFFLASLVLLKLKGRFSVDSIVHREFPLSH